VNDLALKIRLARAGAKKAPFYRVVAADSRAPRDGRFIEILGRYNPRTEPSFVEIDVAKIEAWIAKGAQPTEVVVKLMAIAKGEKVAPAKLDSKVSKKAAAKAADKEKKAAEPAPVAVEAPVAEVAPADETAEVVADEAPAEEAPAEEAPAEEAPAEEAPAEEAPAEEAPAEEAPAEEAPAEEAPAEEAPAEQAAE
jgi:small subunit ribosomal protein S16